MKIERLKKNNLGKWIGILLIVSIVIFVVTFSVTRAKYRYTSKMEIVNGIISYKTGDVSVLAVNIENDDGTYTESDTFPTSGYVINEENSTCFISQNGEKITQDVTLSYTDNTLTITGLKNKGTKCNLYFDIDPCGTACQSIMANNTIDTSRSSGSFTAAFTDDTAGKIFSGTDDYGTTYFFAGSNPNNWVKFAGFYWRIIRINGDGSIRLIYNGTDTSTTGTTTQLSSTSAFNSSIDDNAYVGYMYGTTGSSTYSATHTNTNSSTIKGVLDTWYKSNLLSSYASYIDTNAGFCGDRTIASSSETWWSSDTKKGYGTNATAYAPYGRLILNNSSQSTQTATYKCSQTNDLYTVSSSSYGNKALTYPIGLITSDEVVYAGGFSNKVNSSYWLYTGQTYWTISPYRFDGSNASVFNAMYNGTPGIYDWVSRTFGVRPVINLKSTSSLTGSGTSDDPYIVS